MEEKTYNLLEDIKKTLGYNFNKDDEEVLNQYIDGYKLIASNESHRKLTDKKLIPYVKEAVISSYLRRGKEGNSANTVGSLSDTYIDIVDKLRKDVRSIRILI